jgi:hypothetical protein
MRFNEPRNASLCGEIAGLATGRSLNFHGQCPQLPSRYPSLTEKLLSGCRCSDPYPGHSQRITAVVAGGGVQASGNVRALPGRLPPGDAGGHGSPSGTDVRLDIENRGDNLRT